jgi:hypothetical protein
VHIFIGAFDVFAPVNKVNPAMVISIKADIVYTLIAAGFCDPLKMVTKVTSNPVKHSVRPSAVHFIVTIRLLSSDIDPKSSTMDLVGTI